MAEEVDAANKEAASLAAGKGLPAVVAKKPRTNYDYTTAEKTKAADTADATAEKKQLAWHLQQKPLLQQLK